MVSLLKGRLLENKAYWSGFSGVWCFGEFQICFAFRKLKKINCGTCVCSEGWIQFYCQNKIQTFQLKLLLPFKWTQDRKFVQSFSLCWPAKTYSEMSDPGVSSFRGPNKQIVEIETNTYNSVQRGRWLGILDVHRAMQITHSVLASNKMTMAWCTSQRSRQLLMRCIHC